MLGRKLYVSATDEAGAFTARGMVTQPRAMEALDDFLAEVTFGKAVFMVISGHDGRIELRHGEEGTLRAQVIARNRRDAMLWGLLPARAPIMWEPPALDHDEGRRLVRMIYTLPREGFQARVAQEVTQ